MKSVRHRVSVVVIHNKKILGFHAEDPTSYKKYFFLPGGKIESNESPQEAAIRETLEETGYKIQILPLPSIESRYDFEWSGAIHDCHTIFYAGELSPAIQTATKVDDASYNLGTEWISIEKIDSVFSYDSVILEAVRKLASQIKEK